MLWIITFPLITPSVGKPSAWLNILETHKRAKLLIHNSILAQSQYLGRYTQHCVDPHVDTVHWSTVRVNFAYGTCIEYTYLPFDNIIRSQLVDPNRPAGSIRLYVWMWPIRSMTPFFELFNLDVDSDVFFLPIEKLLQMRLPTSLGRVSVFPITSLEFIITVQYRVCRCNSRKSIFALCSHLSGKSVSNVCWKQGKHLRFFFSLETKLVTLYLK